MSDDIGEAHADMILVKLVIVVRMVRTYSYDEDGDGEACNADCGEWKYNW